ncbi:DNA helicase [Tanacetum coccineum]|uniref:ATP-dependent DNA helicase n=1 Tax=Tanacetum coccineum TaxID=301880 RepID=A0ABQ4ZQ91_9ASTR
MVTTRRNSDDDVPNFEAMIAAAVANALPNLTAALRTQITNDIRNGAESSGGSGGGGDATPQGIHVWIERFNKLKPLAFRSAATPAEAEDWITHMEKLFQVLGCPDNFKTRLAAFKLEGDALSWWKAHLRTQDPVFSPWGDRSYLFMKKEWEHALGIITADQLNRRLIMGSIKGELSLKWRDLLSIGQKPERYINHVMSFVWRQVYYFRREDFRKNTTNSKKGASKKRIIASCISQSELWLHFKVFILKENMRLSKPGVSADERNLISSFASWLLDIGDGKTGEPDQEDPENTNWIHIPLTCCLPDVKQGLSKLIDFIYDQMTLRTPSAITLQKKAIVCPKNETANMINSKVLEMVQGEMTTYLSHDEAIPPECNRADTEMLYHVEHLNTLKFLGDKDDSPDKYDEAELKCISLQRRQFPIKLCYAMTINKSQEQSLSKIGVYLPGTYTLVMVSYMSLYPEPLLPTD